MLKIASTKHWQRACMASTTVILSGCTLGPMEIFLVFLIVLLLFGASRLPALGQALGETLRSFRAAADDEKSRQELAAKNARPLEGAQVRDVSAQDVEPSVSEVRKPSAGTEDDPNKRG